MGIIVMWYRIIGSGTGGGAAKKTPNEAWDSALRRVRLDMVGEYIAAHSLRIVAGTTRRAVEDADVSRTRGVAGRGKWHNYASR